MKEYNSKWTGSEVDTAVQDVKLKISRSEKGVANGVATLDASGKVPTSQIPEGVSGGSLSVEIWE